MDLLFKRYASPFPFLDGMIQSGGFPEFVDNLIETVNREKEEQFDWEFWLHKVWEGTFDDFLKEKEINRNNQTMSKGTIETTVKSSMDILKNFNPTEQGG